VCFAGVARKRRVWRGQIIAFVGHAHHARTMRAFDQHFYRAVGKLQHLQHRGHAPDRVEVLGDGIVLRGRLLRDEQDVLARVHRDVQRLDGFRPPDEQWNDHVREDDDIAQRQ
jgi:hypothetical protein